jgi:hypothetical protein
MPSRRRFVRLPVVMGYLASLKEVGGVCVVIDSAAVVDFEVFGDGGRAGPLEEKKFD